MITRNQIARNLPILAILWPEVRFPLRQLTVFASRESAQPPSPALTLVAITYLLVGMIDATRKRNARTIESRIVSKSVPKGGNSWAEGQSRSSD
jgi:hypothetical protein